MTFLIHFFFFFKYTAVKMGINDLLGSSSIQCTLQIYISKPCFLWFFWWWIAVAVCLFSLCTTSLFFFQWLSLACDFTCLFCKVPWVRVSRSFSAPDEHRLCGQGADRGPIRWRWVSGAIPERCVGSLHLQTPKFWFFLFVFFFLTYQAEAWSAWHSRFPGMWKGDIHLCSCPAI